MVVEDYKKYCDQILELHKESTALAAIKAVDMYYNLLEIYAQDGSIAGDEYYGNNMVAKGQLLCMVALKLKEPSSPSHD